MFNPIETERLLLRGAVPSDTDELVRRRSDPEVARYQNWTVPYPAERARDLIRAVTELGGPQPDEWYMVTIVERHSGAIVGDLALHLTWQGRTAEVGYTLASEHWGRGYAREALGALVAYLFEELGVTRVFGMLHPDNVASAMVLEQTGFLFEGHTRSSYWDGDECSDDWIYGLLREDWSAWRNRHRTKPHDVRLVPVDQSNESSVFKLATHHSERRFVAPMEWSFTDALFPEIVNGAAVVPWMRAIEADGELTGFVMVALTTEHHPEPYLWRLLIDRLHQRRGIGRMALDLVVETCRDRGDTSLLTSWTTGRGNPEPFYLSYGFQRTGNLIDGEIEGRFRFG